MKEEQDLLKEWKAKVSALKFKLGRANDKVFSDAIATEIILRRFFNKSDYTITKSGRESDNYLIYLLSNIKETEIRLLNEMAELLVHSASIKQRVHLKGKNNSTNHAGLSNALFELYIDKFLRSRGITVNENTEYVDELGRVRPLDSHFNYGSQEYLVECFRLADADALSLMQLTERLMRVLLKRKIYAYQAFRGHIGFASSKNLSVAIDKAREKVASIYEAYLKAFDVIDNEAIRIPPKVIEFGYQIDINPFDMSANHEAEWDANSYNTLITFCIGPKSNNPQYAGLTIQAKRMTTEKGVNDKLFDKIKRKRKQHTDFKNNKLFFIEIDLTLGHNPNNPVLVPIYNDQLDIARYKVLVENDHTLLFAFVFKKATDKGIERAMRFLYNPKHELLIKQLQRIYF